VSREDLRDPLGISYWPAYPGRDAMRTPMPWRNVPGGGFTTPGTRPWLPLGATDECNVEEQVSDPASMLTLARDLISLRRRVPGLRTGSYETVAAPEGVWAWRRGGHVAVVLNMSDGGVILEGMRGHILIGTDRERDGESFRDVLTVGAWEGLVAEIDESGSGRGPFTGQARADTPPRPMP
jgi:alpha-glucosidase